MREYEDQINAQDDDTKKKERKMKEKSLAREIYAEPEPWDRETGIKCEF